MRNIRGSSFTAARELLACVSSLIAPFFILIEPAISLSLPGSARMNEYGFIYIPRRFKQRLPFREGDDLTIEVTGEIVVIYKTKR